MTIRYRTHEISDAILDLSDAEESDSCSEYLPEQPQPEDSDDSELSSDSEQEDSVNEDNDDAESNSNRTSRSANSTRREWINCEASQCCRKTI